MCESRCQHLLLVYLKSKLKGYVFHHTVLIYHLVLQFLRFQIAAILAKVIELGRTNSSALDDGYLSANDAALLIC